MTKQCLDVHQMQHLQEMGIKLSNEPLLTWIVDEGEKDKPMLCMASDAVDYVDFSHYCLPAYTLQDVLDALPKEIKYKEKICWLSFEISDEHIGYYYNDYLFRPTWVFDERLRVIDESIIDAAYKLLCRCIENGYVETNKNE